MAKEKVEKTEEPVSDRQARWEALLAAHEKQNPAKHAARKEAGEFDTIPESFQ